MEMEKYSRLHIMMKTSTRVTVHDDEQYPQLFFMNNFFSFGWKREKVEDEEKRSIGVGERQLWRKLVEGERRCDYHLGSVGHHVRVLGINGLP